MASEAASYREDVEQARRRFAEFRQAHAVRSRLPEELWAKAAKLARRLDGITATARVAHPGKRTQVRSVDQVPPLDIVLELRGTRAIPTNFRVVAQRAVRPIT
jgi:hypothetical protein